MGFSALIEAGPVIQVHVATAVLAMVLGPLALLRRKKDRLHKNAGYVWVIAMAVAALSSFFIWELRVVGRFSPIHILSVVTLVGLFGAIYRIKQRDVVGHKRIVWRLYYQAIGIAGLFSFLPGRVMNNLFGFGDPWVVFALAACAFVLLFLGIGRQFKGGLQV